MFVKLIHSIALALVLSLITAPVMAAGNAPKAPGTNTVQTLAKPGEFSVFFDMIKAAEITPMLLQDKKYVVFAPTNAALKQMPALQMADLMKPENKAALARLVTYHIVEGDTTTKDFQKMMEVKSGKAVLQTLEGDNLVITADSKNHMFVADSMNHRAQIIFPDDVQDNGVIHGIDAVMYPKK